MSLPSDPVALAGVACTERKASPTELLSALLTLYLAGGVSQKRAAKLVGLRTEDFAELADLRLCEAAMQRAASEYLKRAFHRQFPHCNPKAWEQARYATKGRRPSDHAREPTKREWALVTPQQRRTLRELVPTPRKLVDPEIVRYLQTHRVPLYRRFPDPPEETGTENDVRELKYG